jgi:hypothetical protein
LDFFSLRQLYGQDNTEMHSLYEMLSRYAFGAASKEGAEVGFKKTVIEEN